MLVSGMPVAHFGLDRSVLYYSPGNSILNVPTSGGACNKVVPAANAITAMHPAVGDRRQRLPGRRATVRSLWGERFPAGYKVEGRDGGHVLSGPVRSCGGRLA